ncbi:MAG TPA: hypothetical protein VFQ87_07115 [Bradyrhizobium sp.]|jgi:hypothetical protein|nr:hypothetical protein [Bradyrhizobium sp.]
MRSLDLNASHAFPVMRRLVPAIHVFFVATLKDVDAREKPAHDDVERAAR